MTPPHAAGVFALVLAAVIFAYMLGRQSRKPEIERLEGKLDVAEGESLRFQKAYAAKVEQVGVLSLELARAEDQIRDMKAKVPVRGAGGKFAPKKK